MESKFLDQDVDVVSLANKGKVFGGVFMLSRCFLDCSVGVGVFVTGLSQISSFFSSYWMLCRQEL